MNLPTQRTFSASKRLSRKTVFFLFAVLTFFAVGTYAFTNTSSSFSIVRSAQAIGENTKLFNPNSPFNRRVPSSAQYRTQSQVGTLRPTAEEYSAPIYRTWPSPTTPLVTITNGYGRVEKWPIPSSAQPSSSEDAHMIVFDHTTGTIYEFWRASWQNSLSLTAGNMQSYPMQGTGLKFPSTTAAGFATSAGMVIREDFRDIFTNRLDPSKTINHALSISLPTELVKRDAYVAPALNGERNGSSSGSIPMGALYALPRDLEIEKLNAHPFTKTVARALRDYGAYVGDRNGTQPFNDTGVGTFRVEPGLIKAMYGEEHSTVMRRVQDEMYAIIREHGLYRIEGIDFSYVNDPVASPVPSPSPLPSPSLTPSPVPTPSTLPNPSLVPEPSPTLAPNSFGLHPSADTYVRRAELELVDNGNSVLKSGSEAGDISYLRFNANKMKPDWVKSVTLFVYITNPSAGEQRIHAVSNDWKDWELKYTNRPELGSEVARFNPEGKTGWFAIDITNYVKGKAGDAFSIGILSESADGFWFESAEGTRKPYIQVTMN